MKLKMRMRIEKKRLMEDSNVQTFLSLKVISRSGYLQTASKTARSSFLPASSKKERHKA